MGPHKKEFRVARRVVPFPVFDVTLFTALPAMGELIQFGDEAD